MPAVCVQSHQQRLSPLLSPAQSSVAVSHGRDTFTDSALPLKAKTGPRLGIGARLLLRICLFWGAVYAGSTSAGSLGNFPLAESNQPLSTGEGSVFIHGSFMLWQCHVWNFGLSYRRSPCERTCVSLPPAPP